MRAQGSDGGHNGLRHINETLGHQNYARLRVGIGHEFSEGQQIDYVLGEWDEEEKKTLPALLERAADAAKTFGLQGIDRAMTIYNSKM
jgi:PTH1 family peptidyl-tRNA hydrolase